MFRPKTIGGFRLIKAMMPNGFSERFRLHDSNFITVCIMFTHIAPSHKTRLNSEFLR